MIKLLSSPGIYDLAEQYVAQVKATILKSS